LEQGRERLRIEFNPDPEVVLSTTTDSIVFIHVGKCAGESIMHALRRRLPDDLTMWEMHVYDADRRIRRIVEAAPENITYLVAKRDPVARYISAYNWDKHNLFLKGTLKGTKWEDFYRRFPTVEALVSGLSASDPCEREMATEFSRFGHMGMGQAWYTPPDVLDRLPRDRTHCLDTATLRRDLLGVLDALGHPVTDPDWQPPALKSGFADAYENAADLFPTYLSEGNRVTLAGHIADDIGIYRTLENCS
jgi:hypothetical protein